jgi:hypothetical protein
VTAAIVLGSVVLIAAAVVPGLRWWTRPTVFGSLGDRFVAAPLPVADALLASAVTFPREAGAQTVTITGAHAVLEENTAAAAVAFSICHLSAGEIPILAVHDPQNGCRDREPLRTGAVLRQRTSGAGDYLIVTITPTKAGVARLTSVDLTYRRGVRHLLQHGTERIDLDRTAVATGG